MKYADRPLYLDRIKQFSGNGNVKIISGIRRSGKSTLLKGLDRITDGKILLLDMELWDNRRFRDPDTVYRFIRESLDGGTSVVVIDEVQDID